MIDVFALLPIESKALWHREDYTSRPYMNRRGPKSVLKLFTRIAHRSQIVHECIEPNVNRVGVVIGHPDSPGCPLHWPRNAEILQTTSVLDPVGQRFVKLCRSHCFHCEINVCSQFTEINCSQKRTYCLLPFASYHFSTNTSDHLEMNSNETCNFPLPSIRQDGPIRQRL